MISLILILSALVLSYLIGSFPSSVIIGKLFYHKDVKALGSCNAGATNAFRVLGKRAGFAVILLDMLKGVVAVWAISLLISLDVISQLIFAQNFDQLSVLDQLSLKRAVQLCCGLTAVIGHVFSVFARFKGGKGVATSAAVFSSLFPFSTLVLMPIFFVSLILGGMVSLSSILTAIIFPLTVFLFDYLQIAPSPLYLKVISILIAFFILFTHRQNVVRIVKGKENKFENLLFFKRIYRYLFKSEK